MRLTPVETGRRSMTQTQSNSIQNIPNKRLSVQVSLTGLSFLVTNIGRSEVLHFSEKKYPKSRTPEELLIDVEAFVEEHISEPESFESVKVIYSNPEFALVPVSLFDESKASDYLKFNSKILTNDFIAWDELHDRNLMVVYVPYVNLNNYLYDTFGSFEYYHLITSFLNLIPPANRFTGDAEVFIHVERSNFQLVVQKDGNLQLCNSYPYQTPEDFIYYVLFCFEQLELNPDEVKVTLLGMISETDPLYEIAYTYIRHLEFIDDNSALPGLPEVQSHEKLLLKSM